MLLTNLQTPHFLRKKRSRYALLLMASLLILAFCTLSYTGFGLTAYRKAGANGMLPVCLSLMSIVWFLNKMAGYILTRRESTFQTILQFLLAVPFSLISVLGVFFEANKTHAFTDSLQTDYALFSFVAALLGGLLFFVILFRLINRLDDIARSCKLFCQKTLTGFWGKYLFLNCLWVLLLCWLPQYIIRFPGVMTFDNWQSLAMYYGYTETTTQHPLIWNVLLGKLTDFGVAVNIPWLASFAICLAQHILGMLVSAYTVCTIKKMGFGKGYLAGVLAFFAVLPPMSLYASTAYNDFLFSLGILLLTVEFVYYLYDRKSFFSKPHHWALTSLAVLSTIFRYNGLYTMLAVIAAVGIRELCLLIKRKGNFIQAAALLLVLLIVPVLCGQMLQATLNEKYDAKPITSRAMLALPIQQTVRCLALHGDQIPEQDYQAIHAVLTWSDEKYAKEYDPRNFDSVKESFKTDASTQEIAAFIKAWLGLVLRFPKTCFMATANQTYYLFSPLVRNIRYYISNSEHTILAYPRYGFDPTPYTYVNETLQEKCLELEAFHNEVFPTLPVLGLTVSPAVYTILLLGICLCTLFRKDRRVLILAVALLVTLAITFVGPAVYRHPRYVYPIMFSMPVLLAAFMLPREENTFTEAKL